MNAVRGRKGFTLVEVVSVIAILGVVGTIGTVAFFRITDLWNQTRIRAELDAVAQRAFDVMGKDLKEILPIHLSGHPLTGTTGTTQDTNQFWGSVLNDDQVAFVTRVPAGEGTTVPVRVSYALDRERMALVRKTVAPALQDRTPPPDWVVAEGVIDLCIEYAQKGSEAGWFRGWSSDRLPSAVRVSVTVVHPTRTYEQVARKAVLPIPVE